MAELNIYQRMAAATADMETVAKNLNVTTGKTGGSYKAVSERDVLDAVKKVEVKHGIYSYPADRRIVESEQLETETQYGKKTTFFIRIETVYRFVNIDKPDEYIEVRAYGDGLDSGDKSVGKAVTYSDKYCLLKAYKISTGDDPDQEASKETTYTKRSTYRGKTDFTKPATDQALVGKIREYCLTAAIPENWLAGKFDKSSLEELTDDQIMYALNRKGSIYETYQKETEK